LLATILLLLLVNAAQDHALRLADALIQAMKSNPACMVGPTSNN